MARRTTVLLVLAACFVCPTAAGAGFHIDLGDASIGGAVEVADVSDFETTKVTLARTNVTGAVSISNISNTTLTVKLHDVLSLIHI